MDKDRYQKEQRQPGVLERAWASYEREIIPKTAGAVQREECLRAFFAGAMSAFTGIVNGLSCEEDATEHDLAVIDGIHQELEAYNLRMTVMAVKQAMGERRRS